MVKSLNRPPLVGMNAGGGVVVDDVQAFQSADVSAVDPGL
jgi:hypothetical protein